jgi:glucosamine--fructose-6-phosphate aminotransferase (isomerizing)
MEQEYLNEIMEQPAALRRAVEAYPAGHADLARLGARVTAHAYRQVILTGMGISYHSCYPLWLALSQARVPAAWWDASELVHYAPQALGPDTLLVVVSQSGESAELKRLIELGRRPGQIVSVTNGLANSVAGWADLRLSTEAGPERAVSTKTYITGLAVLHLLGLDLLGGDVAAARSELGRVADHVEDFLNDWQARIEPAAGFLGVCDTLAFLARGTSMASAMAGALMAAEASRIFGAALSAAQFKHGPIEAVGDSYRAVMFAGGDDTWSLNQGMAADIAGFGGRVLWISPRAWTGAPPGGVAELSIASEPAGLLPILEIIPVQLLTIALARLKGYEPATFVNCSKVTEEE